VEIKSLTAWLEKSAAALPYGEVIVKVIIHAGKIKRVEKTITIKEQDISKEAASSTVTEQRG